MSSPLRRIREKTSVFERIKVAAHTTARTLGALFALGTVIVVVVVGRVTRVAVGATAATTAAAVIAVIIAVTVATVVIGTTTTRTILIITITVIAVIIGTTTTRTILIITIVVAILVTVATRTILVITVVTAIIAGTAIVTTVITAIVTTATAATTATLLTTATAGVGFLILETRDGQADLAAIVNALHDDLNGVAFLQHVFDGVDALAVGEVANLADMQQTVGARGQVHESAERRGLDDLAVVGFAGFRNVRVGDLVDDLLGLSAASPPSEEM